MKKIIFVVASLFLISIIGLLIYVLYPRKYNVLPYKKIGTTEYWSLSTGSNIGYVYINGKGSKKNQPILYLHGGPGGFVTEKTITKLVPFSEEGYDVYAYDQIGSGSSQRLDQIKEYTVNRHKTDLEEIIKKIGADKVILIGQSWGSVLATFFVADNPNMVDRIIMTGPGPIFPIDKEVAKLKQPDSLHLKAPLFSNKQANTIYSFRDQLIRKYARTTGNKLASDKEVDDFFTYLNTALKKSTVCDTSFIKKSSGGGGYYAHIMTFNSLQNVQDPREILTTLDTPVFIMKGQCDNQKWGFTREYLDYFQNSTLKIIPNAGHAIDVEQLDVYNSEIIDFLKKDIGR